MQTNDPVISLAADYRRAERAMARNCHDQAKWDADFKQYKRAESKLFRAKPTSYRGARLMINLVRNELAIWDHKGIKSLATELERPLADLKAGGHKYTTWTHLDLVVQYLKRLLAYDPAFRRLRRALRAVCDFIKAEGGRPDPRKFSIRIV